MADGGHTNESVISSYINGMMIAFRNDLLLLMPLITGYCPMSVSTVFNKASSSSYVVIILD